MKASYPSSYASGLVKFAQPAMGIVTAAITVFVVFSTSTVWAKKVEYRKTQEVNFDAVDVDGQVRNPDGAYVVQKRVIDFLPLYKVRRNFDENIKESVEYVK